MRYRKSGLFKVRRMVRKYDVEYLKIIASRNRKVANAIFENLVCLRFGAWLSTEWNNAEDQRFPKE